MRESLFGPLTFDLQLSNHYTFVCELRVSILHCMLLEGMRC